MRTVHQVNQVDQDIRDQRVMTVHQESQDVQDLRVPQENPDHMAHKVDQEAQALQESLTHRRTTSPLHIRQLLGEAAGATTEVDDIGAANLDGTWPLHLLECSNRTLVIILRKKQLYTSHIYTLFTSYYNTQCQ